MKVGGGIVVALLPWVAGAALAGGPVAPGDLGSPVAPSGTEATGTQPAAPVPGDPAARRVASGRAANGLDGRVQLLAKELDLDERQQAEVRKILLQQREEVKQAWSNTAVPSEVRIATMRAAGDRTAARIRAILNDSQREKYIKERPARPEHPQSDADLHRWIGAVGKP